MRNNRRIDRAKEIREDKQCSVKEAVRLETLEFEAARIQAYANDPTADPRWNDGCDFAMTQLCKFLGVEPNNVRWDAATEAVDGDVQAVIGNILRAKFGEDFSP